jgi:allene oxide cyclase
MRNRLTYTLAAVAVAALAVAAVAVASGSSAAPQITQPTMLHVVEHPVTDTVVNTGPRGDTTGDLLTFHNKLFNATNTKVVGRDQGSCIRINPARGSWECMWTNFVPGGHITVEGPFFDSHDSIVTVTGGTGGYRNARGQMLLHARANGQFDFEFSLIP